MQNIAGASFPTIPNNTPIDDPFVKKLIKIISKIGMKSLKEEEIEEKKTTLTQFLNVLPYHLCPQEKLPDYILHTKELSLSQFSKEEHAYLKESEVKLLELSKDLSLFDIKIKIIQALTSSIPDLALDLWLGEFSESFTSSKKFSLSFLDAGVELFFALISKNQLNDALVLLSYLSSTKEMTSTEVITSFSLLCQELLKQNHSQSVIQEENQERFEFIARNLAEKNLTPEHSGLRKLINSLSFLGKQPVVDLILNSHLKKLNYSFKNFEKFHLKKPVLLKQFFSASLELEDPSLAIDLFVVLLNHSKHPLEESEFFHYYEQILPKLIINESSISSIEKILKHRISISRDLDASVDLPFINAILKQIDSNNQTLYFGCWKLLCKVLKENTNVTAKFYETLYLFFSKRTIFKNKETNKNEISKKIKEDYIKFVRDIPEVNAVRQDLLKNMGMIAKKSNLFSPEELLSLSKVIFEKIDHFHKMCSKKRLEKASSDLNLALEQFQKHKKPNELYQKLNSIWKSLDDSVEEITIFFEIIYDFYLKKPKKNKCLLSHLENKTIQIIENPNYTTAQKTSFFHTFIYRYLYIFELNANTTKMFINVFEKLTNTLNLKNLFPDRYWEFHFLLYSKTDFKYPPSAKQGLFFAIKHLLADHSTSSNFKTALSLFQYLPLVHENIQNIRKLYHVFFNNFTKLLETSEINESHVRVEDLLSIYKGLSKYLHQTIVTLKEQLKEDSESGSILISEFAGILYLGFYNHIFIDHLSDFFTLLHFTLNLSKYWIAHAKDLVRYQFSYYEFFEKIIKYLNKNNFIDPQGKFPFTELEKHAQFLKNLQFKNPKIAINEIFLKFPLQDLQKPDSEKRNPVPKLILSPNIEKQLITKFNALTRDKKNLTSEANKLIDFFIINKINSPHYIKLLFNTISYQKDKNLKEKAWNYFISIEIPHQNHIDSFHCANIWKTIIEHNFAPETVETLNIINKFFPQINQCFEKSNQITEKIKLFKDLLHRCQKIFVCESKNGAKKVSPHSSSYYSLLTQCAIKLYQRNEHFAAVKEVIVHLFNQYIDDHVPTEIKSHEDLIKIFNLLSLSRLFKIHEDVCYRFEPSLLKKHFDIYFEEEMNKWESLTEHNKVLKIKDLFLITESLNQIIFPHVDRHIEPLALIYQKALDFLPRVDDCAEYLNLFDWAKQKAAKDYEKIDSDLQNQKRLFKKFRQISEGIRDQGSFDLQIYLFLIHLDILFESNIKPALKKNSLKLLCNSYLKKYSVKSEYEKMQLFKLCWSLIPYYSNDNEFYEILLTIVTLPTQTNLYLFEPKNNTLNFADRKETVLAFFNKYLNKNTPNNFIRCVHIAKFLSNYDLEFSKTLYFSIIDKYQTNLFSSSNTSSLFEIILNSLGGENTNEKKIFKHQIMQALIAQCSKNLDWQSTKDVFIKVIGFLKKGYDKYHDPRNAFLFMNYLIDFFHTRLIEKDFADINQEIGQFLKVSSPACNAGRPFSTLAWTNWLKYNHRHFTEIFKVSPIELMGGDEAFKCIFAEDEFEKEAQYYCESLEELSQKSVDALIDKIKSSSHDDSSFPYLCKETLDYLIQNQIDQAIDLFNFILEDERFEFRDRITYAYYIYDKLNQLSQHNPVADKQPHLEINFTKFFNKTKDCKNVNYISLTELIILLDKRGDLETKNRLKQFLHERTSEKENRFFLFTLAVQQWDQHLYNEFEETMHQMILSLRKEKSIKEESWLQVFELIHLSNKTKSDEQVSQRLNTEILNALFSISADNESCTPLWLIAFQRIENSTEFLSQLLDEEKVNYLFKVFEASHSSHKDFYTLFIRQYIKAIDLLDKNLDKIEKLKKIKFRIQEKAGEQGLQIAQIILALDLKIIQETIVANPDKALPNFIEFLNTSLASLFQIPQATLKTSIHSIFNLLAPFLTLSESLSVEFKKFITNKLSSLADSPAKFDILICLTNKIYENKLLSSEDHTEILNELDCHIYELLINKLKTDAKDLINQKETDNYFGIAVTYAQYFSQNISRLMDLIESLTSYALEELKNSLKSPEDLKISKTFITRMKSIMKLVKYNEQVLYCAFLNKVIHFYYQMVPKKITSWFRDFLNYIEKRPKNLKPLDPTQYWTLKILANNSVTKEHTEDTCIKNILPDVIEKLLNTPNLPGILKAIEILYNWENFLSDETTINLYGVLTEKLKSELSSFTSDHDKKLIKKGLIKHLLGFRQIISERTFASAEKLKKVVEDIFFIVNHCAKNKFYTEKEKIDFHTIIYLIIEQNIQLEKKYKLPTSNFEKIVDILSSYSILYPTENPANKTFENYSREFFSRMRQNRENSAQELLSFLNEKSGNVPSSPQVQHK